MNKLIKPLSVSSSIFALVLTLLVLFIAASAHANTNATNTHPEVKAEAIKARMASSTKPGLSPLRAIGSSTPANWKERVQQLSIGGLDRFSLVITTMQGIIDNLQTRTEALGEKYNIDVSSPMSKLQEAETKINAAKTSLADIRSDLASLSGTASSEVAKADLGELRIKLQALRDNLHQARALMHEALAELKAALRNASSSRVSDAVRQNTASSSAE